MIYVPINNLRTYSIKTSFSATSTIIRTIYICIIYLCVYLFLVYVFNASHITLFWPKYSIILYEKKQNKLQNYDTFNYRRRSIKINSNLINSNGTRNIW